MKKPLLSRAAIWNMSVGFLGIQTGFALQNANASRILQTLGADTAHLGWFWLVAPITGMLVQPIIGHYSDRTWTKMGSYHGIDRFDNDAQCRAFYGYFACFVGRSRYVDDHGYFF